MHEQTEILKEIRDLLLLLAEPAIATRDQKLREALKKITGKSKNKMRVAYFLDGIKSQAEIQKLAKIDAGDLSRFLKSLRESSLLVDGSKNPKLSIDIPSNFFEE